MRTTVVSSALAALFLAAAPLAGQGFFTNAQRAGMGGVSLRVDASLSRYNVAYRAVPPRTIQGGAKASIPIPFGLIQFFKDHPIGNLTNDPLFHPDSARFNPVELLNLILSPPLFIQVKEPPTPTNDVTFGIGKDLLQVDLGKAQTLIPAEPFGLAWSSRPITVEPDFHGVQVGVAMWLHNEVELQLGDSLLALLKDAHPARHQTLYNVLGNGLAEGGLAPSVGYSGRVYGNEDRSMYAGVGVHYYLGAAYGSSTGSGGFTTGDTIFAGANPVRPDLRATTSYSKWGNSLGHGVGVDAGVAWVAGPIVFGVGVNDIGATITWPDTRIDYQRYDTTTVSGSARGWVTDSTKMHVETKTKLPVSYLANVIYSLGSSTVGAEVLNNGRGATVHVGAEQRFGPIAVRGGIARDQRKKVEFGFGGGVRFGPFGFDLGFWTRSNALADQRAISMATSLAIY